MWRIFFKNWLQDSHKLVHLRDRHTVAFFFGLAAISAYLTLMKRDFMRDRQYIDWEPPTPYGEDLPSKEAYLASLEEK